MRQNRLECFKTPNIFHFVDARRTGKAEGAAARMALNRRRFRRF